LVGNGKITGKVVVIRYLVLVEVKPHAAGHVQDRTAVFFAVRKVNPEEVESLGLK
jgi:hypothetical protein